MGNYVSRFNDTPKITYKGHSTYGTWVSPIDFNAIPIANINTFVIPTGMAGRADLIANILYGDPRYDFILYAYNNIVDTINWPPVGLIMKYPSADYILPRVS